MDKQHGVTGICSSARTGREKLGASRDEEEHERRVRRASSGLCLSRSALSGYLLLLLLYETTS